MKDLREGLPARAARRLPRPRALAASSPRGSWMCRRAEASQSVLSFL